ncbi:hypothetical protein H2204_003387 [Knufia peltigerae]|uniref:BZIP domain-containing protein n=1 Tax=Knufia peltigerae TaxID=1002370 RepID=A0AA38Y995_9EURO|nr:hypothetical protein H2204_003387 [Knufia peltigerae]
MSSISSSAPNRNTLNQRASRARRKTYISDLERKVRDFEAHGVKATEEVQRAARRVADENRLLREQIHALRVRNAELEALLAPGSTTTAGAHGNGTLQYSYNQPNMTTKESEQQYPSPPQIFEASTTCVKSERDERDLAGAELLAAASSSYGNYPRFGQQPSTTHDETSSVPGPVLGGSRSASPISDDGTVDMDDDDEQSSVTTPHRHTQTNTYHTLNHSNTSPSHHENNAPWSNSTSCAQAAMIIASMRGLPSSDECIASEILSELGCRPSSNGRGNHINHKVVYSNLTSDTNKQCSSQDLQNCHVENTRLFGILDQEKRFA